MINAKWLNPDICVYGDSPAAVAAAVQSARHGKMTLLAVPGQYVGGILSNGLGSNDLDNHNFTNSVAVGGIASEYYQRVAAKYGGGNGYRTEPGVAESVFVDMLMEADVDVRYGLRLKESEGVEWSGSDISALHFENGDSVAANVYIDGTVEGDLMAFAGVSYTYGREGNNVYGETLNGVVEESNYRQFSLNIDPYTEQGNPDSGLIATIQDEVLGTPGSGDSRSMGFCFRMCLTNLASNRISVSKPKNYDSADYEIYRRYFAAGGASSFFRPKENVPGNKTDLGSWHELSANLYGLNCGWPDGSYAEREAIYNHHRNFTLGLIWFLQNDPLVPSSVRSDWQNWGLPADEFQDNGNWPRQLYIRNGRRMISDWIINEHDLTQHNPKIADDSIAVAYWPPDMHHSRRIVRNGKVWNEGFVFGGDLNWRPFGISYRAIRPKANECTNLLVPAALSSSYVGYGAVRLEWTFMVLGQSAGTAAVLSLRDRCTVQDVDYEQLKLHLVADGQILELTNNDSQSNSIVLDAESSDTETIGQWGTSNFYSGYIGSGYLHDQNSGKGTKKVIFRNLVNDSGTYRLYGYWNADDARSKTVPIQVQHSGGSTSLIIDQTQNHHQWTQLGIFTFSATADESISVSNSGTDDGYVIVDAFRLDRIDVPVALPEISLIATRTEMTQDGKRVAEVRLLCDQPLPQNINVELEVSGTVNPNIELKDALPSALELPSGQSSLSFEVQATSNVEIEGLEQIEIRISGHSRNVRLGKQDRVVLNLHDDSYQN